VKFHIGVDLGQANDYTAVCVIETLRPHEIHEGRLLVVRHLTRFRDVLYPDVADMVEKLMKHPRLSGRAALAVDATGVGPAVTDLLKKRGMSLKEVKIHGGDSETRGEGGVHRVPKRNLVSTLQVALQTGVLKIPSKLELGETLRDELMNFRVKVNVSTGHDSYEAWREGDHDDLVLAAALAAWSASKFPTDIGFPIGVGPGGGMGGYLSAVRGAS
jgi:hypothetical protein